MVYEAKTVQLKNGREALLRAPFPKEDAAALAAFMVQCYGETEFLTKYPEEFTITPEKEQAYLEKSIASPTEMMIVCTIDGELAGNCQISFNTAIKTKHRASVSIALLQRFWGLGIGTAMFQELLAAAKKQGVAQVELDYLEGNQRALAFYQKMGFTPAASLPNAFRLKDGTSLSQITMIKQLGTGEEGASFGTASSNPYF